jgi:hypothetical protein
MGPARAAGQRLDQARDRSVAVSVERAQSMSRVVRQAGQWTHRKWCRAASAAPIVGANSKGIRRAWRSFQAAIRRSASAST